MNGTIKFRTGDHIVYTGDTGSWDHRSGVIVKAMAGLTKLYFIRWSGSKKKKCDVAVAEYVDVRYDLDPAYLSKKIKEFCGVVVVHE